MTRLLICGSRGWRDPGPIEAVLVEHLRRAKERGEQLVVIHGACKDGADQMADRLARSHGLSVAASTLIRVPADWHQYGKSAGFRRNERMATEFEPDEVHAFRAPGKSNGTDHMIEIAKTFGIPAYCHTVLD